MAHVRSGLGVRGLNIILIALKGAIIIIFNRFKKDFLKKVTLDIEYKEINIIIGRSKGFNYPIFEYNCININNIRLIIVVEGARILIYDEGKEEEEGRNNNYKYKVIILAGKGKEEVRLFIPLSLIPLPGVYKAVKGKL
ncbi:hypothetical protein B0T20DRAFT_388921 [Sordaria brevicollis]|uniref:Uncharacterized protein n=1 Tax=Sordaria brevicollis TaxID=83679 RepID=A0AAE0PNZ2_SORBR|nr:hypothetical protein B0T20DRAFT_388921 [Sordaria brevicollis]